MARRLAAVALVAALAGAVAAPPASAAYCGPLLDEVSRLLPEPARQLYLKVCGV